MGGLAAGLGLAPLIAAGRPAALLVTAGLAAGLLAWRGPGSGRSAAVAWLAVVAVTAAAAGLAVGSARIASIDAGALRGHPGSALELSGRVAGTPRADSQGYAAELATDYGRVLLSSPEAGELAVGTEVRVRGRLGPAPLWRSAALARRGITMVLEAERIAVVGRRGGLPGRIDGIRIRAEDALERGMPEREAALARGFVLGQDDRIDAATREDFRRSGLAHLLAVSGQNVILLCLLAWPLLALAGVTLRVRLLVLLCLIALYVPITGAGPSIQRAAVMGAAGVVAALADRPGSRWYALALAAAVTLALNPRAAGDVGWQLSFAAVVGIFLWTGRLAALAAGAAERGSPRRAVAEGLAVTLAATVATAPLMAHHFEALSVAALPANLLALPAVAPAMWLGMLAGIAGQLPAVPVEPLNWLNSLCLGYIAQVAHWFGSPSWAQLELGLGDPLWTGGAYLVLIGAMELFIAAAQRRRGLGPPVAGRGRRTRRMGALAGAAALLFALVIAAGAFRGGEHPTAPPDALTVRILDVGQGDAILLDPPAAEPLLVDAGPPGAGVSAHLRELGVEALAALVITHDQSDHSGSAADVLRELPVDRVALAAPAPRLAALASAAGAEAIRIAEGGELRSGELRLSVLWPPPELLDASNEDPNHLSAVLLAEWAHFSILLTGDAEAEAVPLNPGPVDVLKVAHHGSADEGLEALLDHTAPKLAVISVGENPYGHPAPETIADLAEHGVPALRTDRDGEVVIEADAGGWGVLGGD